MKLHVNGQATEVDGQVTLLEYLQQRGVEPDHVVVELNRDIIERQQFGETRLQEGDTLELLRFVGGG